MADALPNRQVPFVAKLRAIFILVLFLLTIVVLAPFQITILGLRFRDYYMHIPVLFHNFVLKRIFGFRVTVTGQIADPSTEDGPVLYVSNHNSWLDIPVLGSVMPCSFIAKAEVETWPLFGWLAQMQRTLFVEREARSQTAQQTAAILDRMAHNDRLVLFAEGTSSDGNRVLKFNSSLFGVAQLAELHPTMPSLRIQPVSVVYTKVQGLPMGRFYRPFFAWYGDMDLPPHLWAGLCLGPADIEVIFHEPITLPQAGNRKKLAKHCEAEVSRGMKQVLLGREDVE